MERDPLHNLESLKIKPLSDGEQDSVWLSIKSKLATTPVESPFATSSFFSSKALAYAFAFFVVFGTVGASNRAAPASRVDHARERLHEFDRSLGIAPTTVENDGADLRMQTNLAPEAAETEMMATFMIADDTAQKSALSDPSRELPPDVQATVEATRRELLKIEAEATLKGDFETLADIQNTINEFEMRVNAL
jgi:hypothetical protein